MFVEFLTGFFALAITWMIYLIIKDVLWMLGDWVVDLIKIRIFTKTLNVQNFIKILIGILVFVLIIVASILVGSWLVPYLQ